MAIEIKFKEKRENQNTLKSNQYTFDRTFISSANYEYIFKSFDLINQLNTLPKKNQQLHIIFNKGGRLFDMLNLFESIECIIAQFAVIEECQVDILNKINKTDLVISRHDLKSNKLPLSKCVENIITPNIKLRTTHIKLLLIQTDDGYYSVETTLNPKIGSSLESMVITNCSNRFNSFKKICYDM